MTRSAGMAIAEGNGVVAWWRGGVVELLQALLLNAPALHYSSTSSRPHSNIPARSSLLYRNLVSALEDAGLAPFQFVANGPVIFPNEIGCLLGGWIDQHQRALEIVNQFVIGEVLHVPEHPIIEALRLLPVTTAVEDNKCLSHFDVFCLVHMDLPKNHDAAKRKHRREDQGKLEFQQESHKPFLRDLARPVQLLCPWNLHGDWLF
jgi:hypothetical protein